MGTGGWREQLRARLWAGLLGFLGFFPRTNPPSDDQAEDLLEAALEVSQTQVLAQLAEETSIDGETMGWLAFLGALLAVDVAAKDLLHKWWWTPLIGVAVAMVPCLISIFAAPPQLGPRIVPFYERFGGYESKAARTQLLADMYASFRANGIRVRGKRRRLRLAVVTTIVGLIGAALMITLDTPTKLRNHGTQTPAHRQRNTHPASARTRIGAGPIPGAYSHTVRLVR
jgi:hypothetical protein